MALDALSPSALQSALTLALHLVLPSFALGLAHYLAVLEGLLLISRNGAFRTLYLNWLGVFGIALVLAGLAAVLMPPATAPPASGTWAAIVLAAGLAAFMLLGWRRTGSAPHFLATLGMAFCVLAWAAWVMFDPGAAHPSADTRGAVGAGEFTHPWPLSQLVRLVLSGYLTTALVVAAAASWRLLRDPMEAESGVALRMAIGMFAIVAPLLFIDAGLAGRPVQRSGPVQLAAIESSQSVRGSAAGRAPTRSERDAVADARQALPAPAARRVLAGLGLGVIGLAGWGAALMLRGRLERGRAFQIACVAMGPAGCVVVACWIVAHGSVPPAP